VRLDRTSGQGMAPTFCRLQLPMAPAARTFWMLVQEVTRFTPQLASGQDRLEGLRPGVRRLATRGHACEKHE